MDVIFCKNLAFEITINCLSQNWAILGLNRSSVDQINDFWAKPENQNSFLSSVKCKPDMSNVVNLPD